MGAALAVLSVAPVRADEKADALLKEVAATTKETQSLTANLQFSLEIQKKEQVFTGTIRLKKPNLARIDLTRPSNQLIVSDGDNVWLLAGDTYTKKPADPHAANIEMDFAVPVNLFFDPQSLGIAKLSGVKRRYVGAETIDHIGYQVVEVSGRQNFDYTLKLYVGPSRLVTRMTGELRHGKDTIRLAVVLSNVKTNPTLTTADFTFTPPKTARLHTNPDDANPPSDK